MSNSIAPGSSADVNVKVTALTTNPNVPVTYKTIILKKNLVNGVNTLTQEMISTTNTKYVVKYDYVLGEDITVPANCELEFDGGSINSAYAITLSAGCKIFNGKISLGENGSIIIGGDNVTIENCDIHKSRENSGSEYSPTYQAIFANGKSNLSLKDNVIVLTGYGSFTTIINCTNVEVLNNQVKNTTFNPAEDSERTCGVELCDSCQYVRIQGNIIENTKLPISAFTNNQKVTDVQILENTIINSMAYGICIYDAALGGTLPVENIVISGNIIKNVYGKESYGAGIYLLESSKIIVSNNYIENTAINTTISGTLAPAGVGLNNSNHIIVSNNIIKTSKYFGIVVHGASNVVSGNIVEDCIKSIELRVLSNSIISDNFLSQGIYGTQSLVNVDIKGNTLSNLNISGTNGHNFSISNNIFTNSGGAGNILLVNDNNTEVIICGNAFYGECNNAIWGSPTNSIYMDNVFLCTPNNTNMQYSGFGSGALVKDNYIKNIKANDLAPVNYTKSGASSSRPAHPIFGMMYKDTTLGKPIWFDGTNWIDATGTPV